MSSWILFFLINCRLSTLIFKKKVFFKRFQFLKKRFYHKKKGFIASAISDFRAKKGFALKKSFFSSPISYTPSG